MNKSDRKICEIYSNFIKLDLNKHLERFLNPCVSLSEPEKFIYYLLESKEIS